MARRFLYIWFRHLLADRVAIRQPDLIGASFVLAAPERGRMVVKAVSKTASRQGIEVGMVVADARAVFPSLIVMDDKPGRAEKLLHGLAEWCIRFTPLVAVDLSDGLVLDVTGCPHLWGGERPYFKEVIRKLSISGYDVRGAIADTPGTAWAVARYGKITPMVEAGAQADALLPLPPAALRLPRDILERMHKLGFYKIQSFINMPRSVLRRRFGQHLLDRLDQALGTVPEPIEPVCPVEPFQERLPCMEPILTAKGIQIALQRLLEALCQRLVSESKGLRSAIFKGFRVDGNIQQIEIGTNGPSCRAEHLFKLFKDKIQTIEPDLGIELFVLEAPVVEEMTNLQEALWSHAGEMDGNGLPELLDRIAGRAGMNCIHRYLPDEHHWPERSVRKAAFLKEMPQTDWKTDRQRPMILLAKPEPVLVTAPVPDYPPILFRYQGKVHRIARADGPERIAGEWWIEESEHRDYYIVEDESGARYWLFRLGHYRPEGQEWFLHGFFA